MMQWFRAKLNVGARLAIFALALQIAVSFGHMHLGDIRHTVGGLSVAETVSVPRHQRNNLSATRTMTPDLRQHLSGCEFLPATGAAVAGAVRSSTNLPF